MRHLPPTPPDTHDVLAVLTTVGEQRDAFHRDLVGEPDIDAGVIAAVLGAHGRVSVTLGSRRTIIALASILRSLDAWRHERIELTELATGCATHASATDRFADFHADVRIELRTLDELLQSAVAGRLSSETALRSQIALLDRALRDWFERELFGNVTSGVAADTPGAGGPGANDDQGADVDVEHARHLDAWSRALLAEDSSTNLFTGLAASCWRSGWVAVAVAGDQLGDAPDERERFGAAVASAGSTWLSVIQLAPPPRWRVHGRAVHVVEPLRAVRRYADVDEGIAAVVEPRRGFAIITDDAQRFAVVERDEHHVVAGRRDFVERYLGEVQLVEAWSQFRLYVEGAYEDDDPPAHLLDAAQDYARASRRGMGAQKL